MGLLKGLSENASWAKRIRGYMTIGSPLNKHVFFWPELFEHVRLRQCRPRDPADPLEELLRLRRPDRLQPAANPRLDEGDEVGPVLRLPGREGRGRHRLHPLLLPGAAHNDYWRDRDVFGHFIQQVVDRTSSVLPPAKGRAIRRCPARSSSRF